MTKESGFKRISVKQLETLLAQQIGAKIVTLVTETEPALKGGKKCPVAGVRKVSRVNGVINWIYANAVNRKLEKEDKPADFVPHPRKWGVRLFDRTTNRVNPLVAGSPCKTLEDYEARIAAGEKVKMHLEYKFEKSLEYAYFLNGQEIPAEDVNPHLRPRNDSGRQGLDNPVILRDPALENIKEISLNGELYVVE